MQNVKYTNNNNLNGVEDQYGYIDSSINSILFPAFYFNQLTSNLTANSQGCFINDYKIRC